MAAKQLVFSEDARRKLKHGMNIVAEAVSATLGPKGRNVAIDRKFGSHTNTHDGVSVAKEIELEDPFENVDPAGTSGSAGRHIARRQVHVRAGQLRGRMCPGPGDDRGRRIPREPHDGVGR